MRTINQAHADLLEKLPPGWAFSRDPTSVVGRTLLPLAAELVRFEDSAEAQLAEATPSTSDKMLPDYERVLGPDPCLAPGATFAERRQSVHARWTNTQGASRADYIAVAAALGFAIAIEEFRPARYGQARYGKPRYGAAWAHVWRVRSAAVTVTQASYGTHRAGEPYSRWSSGVLECTLRRLAPAHTVLLFAYTGAAAIARYGTGVYGRDSYDLSPLTTGPA